MAGSANNNDADETPRPPSFAKSQLNTRNIVIVHVTF